MVIKGTKVRLCILKRSRRKGGKREDRIHSGMKKRSKSTVLLASIISRITIRLPIMTSKKGNKSYSLLAS